MTLLIGDREDNFTHWAVAAWARHSDRLQLRERPLADPLVVLSCGTAQSSQTVANEVGRLVWAPTADSSIGARAISMADKSAGVMVNVTLHRTEGDRTGEFRSAYPQGPAGDLIRWACRERFGTGDVSWVAEKFAPFGTAAPRSIRPRMVKGANRVFGWCYFDERDWNSREALSNPASISSAYATWVPNNTYRPGAPRNLDPQTGKIAGDAEPWHMSGQGALPFSVDDVIFVAGHFADGNFVVTDPESNLSFFESPQDFGVRLKRDHEAAVAAEMARGIVLPRTVVLLTSSEPVPQQAASLVKQAMGDVDVITVSLASTMFLHEHPGAGIPQTRVALVPGRGDASTPVWTKMGSAGAVRLMAPSPSGSSPRRMPRSAPASGPASGPPQPLRVDPFQTRPQDLTQVLLNLQAGAGLRPDGPVPVLAAAYASASVLAVRSGTSVSFSGDPGPGEWSLAISYPLAGSSFDLLEVNAEYHPSTLARLDRATGQHPLTAWPMLVTGRGALPFDAARDVLYVFVDYYGGYFLLRANPGADGAVTTYAESPRDFGRRIRAEIVRTESERGEAAAPKRRVALLAKHRPVPPGVAAMVAQELLGVGGDVYTASMPAAAYVRGAGSDDAEVALALIRLPGHADKPYWTRSTPTGQSARIDTPPQDEIEDDASPNSELKQPSGAGPMLGAEDLPGAIHAGTRRTNDQNEMLSLYYPDSLNEQVGPRELLTGCVADGVTGALALAALGTTPADTLLGAEHTPRTLAAVGALLTGPIYRITAGRHPVDGYQAALTLLAKAGPGATAVLGMTTPSRRGHLITVASGWLGPVFWDFNTRGLAALPADYSSLTLAFVYTSVPPPQTLPPGTPATITILGAPPATTFYGRDTIPMTREQHATLVREGLRPRNDVQPGNHSLLQSIIIQTGGGHLGAVLKNWHFAFTVVTPSVLWRFFAERLGDKKHAARYDRYLISPHGQRLSRDEVVTALKREDFDGVLAALVPRLAADFLGLNLSILNRSGVFENLAPWYKAHTVRLARTGLNYVGLEPGVPGPWRELAESATLPGIPGHIPAGPQVPPALADQTDAAGTLAIALARRSAVQAGRGSADLAKQNSRAAFTGGLAVTTAQRQAALAWARRIAEAMVAAETRAWEDAMTADEAVRGAAATLPSWVFGAGADQQERNWQAVDIAAELARAQALVSAAGSAGPQPAPIQGPPRARDEDVLGDWTVEELADHIGEFAYLSRLLSLAAAARARGQSDAAAARARAVGRPPEHQPSGTILTQEEQDEIATAARNAAAAAAAAAEGELSPDEAAAEAGQAKEHEIRKRKALTARQVSRTMPAGFTYHLDWIERENKVTLGVGEEQRYVGWGEWGQIARIGGVWIDEKADETIAAQGLRGFPKYPGRKEHPIRAAIRNAITSLFKKEGGWVASRLLVASFEVEIPSAHAAGTRVRKAIVEIVLGPLRGSSGPTYVPAYQVEQHLPTGAKIHNSTDPTHAQIGSSGSGFSNNRATTVPLTQAAVPVPHLGPLSPLTVGPSVQPGGGRSFDRYEWNFASADHRSTHTTGLAYFQVPARPDIRQGSHWKITFLDSDGAPALLTTGDPASSTLVTPASVLLSFPLDEAQPTGQTPPRPLGEPPASAADSGRPVLIGKLPAWASDEEAAQFHQSMLAAFATPLAIPVDDGPQGLYQQIIRSFGNPGKDFAESLRGFISEHNFFQHNIMLYTTGLISQKWKIYDDTNKGKSGLTTKDRAKDKPWAKLHLRAQNTEIWRLGGSRNDWIQQDARKLQGAETAAKEIDANNTVYVDTTATVSVPKMAKGSISVFPWVGASTDHNRPEGGEMGSGDWHYVGYQTDQIIYAFVGNYQGRLYSSVTKAAGPVKSTYVAYYKVPKAEVPRFEYLVRLGAKLAEIGVFRRAGDYTGTHDQLRTIEQMRSSLARPVTSDGPRVTDVVPPPSIQRGMSRLNGQIDLVPGAEKVIPQILADMKAAEADRGFTEPRRKDSDWLEIQDELGRLFSAEAIIPLSSLLMSTEIPLTLIFQHLGSQEVWDIAVSWVPDPEAQGVVNQVREGRIDWYPIFWRGAQFTEGLTPGWNWGWVPSLSLTIRGNTRYTLGGGYSRSTSKASSFKAAVQAWASQGAVIEGTLLKARYDGSYRVSVRSMRVPDSWSLGQVKAYAKQARRIVHATRSRQPVPEWNAGAELRYQNTTDIQGWLRIFFPKDLAPPADKPLPELNVRQIRQPAIKPGPWPAAVTPARKVPARPGFADADLGPPGRLRPEDQVLGLPFLRPALAELKAMANAAGLQNWRVGGGYAKKLNEDNMRAQGFWGGGLGGEGLVVSFSLTRAGVPFDKLADVTFVLRFYQMEPTGQVVSFQPNLMGDSEPNLASGWLKTRTHGFYLVPFKVTGGAAPGASADGGISATGNIRTKQRGQSRDITWLRGGWNVHPLRQFAVSTARVGGELTMTVWRENAAAQLAPRKYVSHLLVDHGMDFLRAERRPILLPPPGVPQVLPVGKRPLFSITDQLTFPRQAGGGDGSTLNPVQKSAVEVVAKIHPKALNWEWEEVPRSASANADAGKAKLKRRRLPSHLLSITDEPSLRAQKESMFGPGLLLVTQRSALFRNSRIYLLIRAFPKAYRHRDTLEDASFGVYSVGIDKLIDKHGRVRKPPGVRLEDAASQPIPAANIASISAGSDGWNKNWIMAWQWSETTTDVNAAWLRDVQLVPGQAHHYERGVRVVVSGFVATDPSLPVNFLTLGLPRNLMDVLRKPSSPDQPKASAETSAVELTMMPESGLPAPDRDSKPARWKHVPIPPSSEQKRPPQKHSSFRDVADRVAAAAGLSLIPLTATQLLRHEAYLVDVLEDQIREMHDHLWRKLSGAATTDEGGVPQGLGGKLIHPRMNSKTSRAVGRLLDFGGSGPSMLSAIFSKPAIQRYAQYMIDEEFVFPGLLKDIGLLAAKGDFAMMALFYNPDPGKWYRGRWAGEIVGQPEHGTTRGDGRTFTLSQSVGVDLGYGTTTVAGMPSAVARFGRYNTISASKKNVRSSSYRREAWFLPLHAGMMFIIKAKAVNTLLGFGLPESWGNPIKWLAGGEEMLVYLLDHSATIRLDAGISAELRILTGDGIPLPYGGQFMMRASASKAWDKERVKAAESLRPHGDWLPYFVDDYDAATSTVQITITEPPTSDHKEYWTTERLPIKEAAERIRGLTRWDDTPLLAFGIPWDAAGRLGRLLGVDVVTPLDGLLQHDFLNLARRFDVDSDGRPVLRTVRPGNFVLLPADGSGPLLLSGDLGQVMTADLPARLRGPEAAPIFGVSQPELPVGWPSGSAAGHTQAGLAETGSDKESRLGSAKVIDLGHGFKAQTTGPAARQSVLVLAAGDTRERWQQILDPDLMPHRDGYVTVVILEPHPNQAAFTLALDRLLLDPIFRTSRGADRGILLIMPHAAGRGPDSLAHRLQQRAQRLTPARWGDPGKITGPSIIAPGGSLLHTWVGDEGSLFTYHEDDHTAQWWEFKPNAVPEPLGPLLAQAELPAARAAVARPAPAPRVPYGLLARRIPAGYLLTNLETGSPPTPEQFGNLARWRAEPGRTRIFLGDDDYDQELLGSFLDSLGRDTVVVATAAIGERPPDGHAGRKAVITPLEPPGDRAPDGGGMPGGHMPNGLVNNDLQGTPYVWRTREGGGYYRPIAQYLTTAEERDPLHPGEHASFLPVARILPLSLFLREGHGLVVDPARPHMLTLPGSEAVVEITGAGLWLREAGEISADQAVIRGWPADPDGPLIVVGIPGKLVSPATWSLTRRLIAHLLPEAKRGGRMKVVADVDPDTSRQARRLAAIGGLSLAAIDTVVPPQRDAASQPQVTPAGPLPTHEVPADLPDPGEIAKPPRSWAGSFGHGIPTVAAGLAQNQGPQAVRQRAEEQRAAGALPEGQVVLNSVPQHAYIVVPPLTGAQGASGPLALPPEGFFRAQIRATRPPISEAGPGSIMIRVSIPAGAAILPLATWGVPPREDDAGPHEPEVWLPAPTLARIQATKAYTVSERGYTTRPLSADLASQTVGHPGQVVPQRGSASVFAPGLSWSDKEIEEYFLGDNGLTQAGEPIPAGWWFHDSDLAADAAAREAAALLVRGIPKIPGETALVFRADPRGLPLLNGRPTRASEFVRVLAILVARHPDLNERAFRLVLLPPSPGWGSPGRHGAGLASAQAGDGAGDLPDAYFEFAGRTADYSRRPMIVPTTQVFIGDDEPLPHTGERLLYGTLVATGTQQDGNGQAVPIMPPSGEWLLLMPGSGHAMVLGVSPPARSTRQKPKPADIQRQPVSSPEPLPKTALTVEDQSIAPGKLPGARLESDPGQRSPSRV